MLPVVPTFPPWSQLLSAALHRLLGGGRGRWKTLHLGSLGLSSHLCGGFGMGGGPGEPRGLLAHPDTSLFLLPPSHLFLVLCTSHLFKLEGFKLSFLPCNVPREFSPGFSESLLVGITLLVPPPLMSWEIWTEKGAQEEPGVGKVMQKVDAHSPPSLPCHPNWEAHGQAVSTDSFVAFQASIRLPKKVETVSFPPSQEQTGVCRRGSLCRGLPPRAWDFCWFRLWCDLGSPSPRAAR